jgi:DNA-directed RNA polymerase specialized sigma24 family protein
MEGAMAGEFEELYTSTFGRLVGQLFLVTGDLHEAEEVVQEAFTRAAGRWHGLREYDYRSSAQSREHRVPGPVRPQTP